eukprot:1629889-Rhodomonas_salina.1
MAAVRIEFDTFWYLSLLASYAMSVIASSRFVMPDTDLWYAAIQCYAMPGTDLSYAATRWDRDSAAPSPPPSSPPRTLVQV